MEPSKNNYFWAMCVASILMWVATFYVQPIKADCASYCNAMNVTCPTEYPDNDTCINTCFTFPAGTPNDVGNVNSLGCREYQLTKGRQGCPYAGKTGGDICVSLYLNGTCKDYCDVVTRYCYGDNKQYDSPEECLKECPIFSLGTPFDSIGNTFNCRYHHAITTTYVDSAKNVHCPHAGPVGGLPGQPVCNVELCDNYCDNMMAANCNKYVTSPDDAFATRDDCMKKCRTYDSWALGDKSGDSVQCRSYYALKAYVKGGNQTAQFSDGSRTKTALYCDAASPSGGGICTGLAYGCSRYCYDYIRLCNTEVGPFEYGSMQECLLACAAYPTPTFDVSSYYNIIYKYYIVTDPDKQNNEGTGIYVPPYLQNTQYCRNLQLFRIDYPVDNDEQPSDPVGFYCPSAGPSGAPLCGDICDGYCNNMLKACPTTFSNRKACTDTCKTFNQEGGTPNDLNGNSLHCRMTYSLKALLKYPAPDYCTAASLTSTQCVDSFTGDATYQGDAPSSAVSCFVPFSAVAFAVILFIFLSLGMF